MPKVTFDVNPMDYVIIEELGRARGVSPEVVCKSAALYLAYHEGIVHRLVREKKVPKAALG